MGHLQATEMSERLDMETALTWHLQHNHYPPVPTSMVETCITAINHANMEGDWHDEIELPEGITYRGRTTAPVYAIIEQHHLDAWLT